MEQISHIRADGAHLVKTVYRPTTCGTHVVSLQVMNTAVQGQATVEVAVDAVRGTEELMSFARWLPHGNVFLSPLVAARAAFERGTPGPGVVALEQFRATVQTLLAGVPFSDALVSLLLAKVDRILSCAG